MTVRSMLFTIQSSIRLNNEVEMPRLGLGVYQSPPGRITQRVVRYALNIGYRHIDTAYIYGNESDIGNAVLESGISREEVFVTTKLWNTDQVGYDYAIKACKQSLQRLGLKYIDLYLIHWPVHGVNNNSIKIWKAMVNLLREGKARAIGVSNFSIDDLKQILNDSDVLPAVNQVEFHPFLYQTDLLSFCERNSIQLEAYSPLTRGRRLNHPTIVNIAKKYDNKTPAQILIRWSLQHNLVVIPKSIHEERILENSHVFDFELRTEDMKFLDSLNENLQTVFSD
jgi:diketogulonate reductase-like aldo/keto reductase